MLIKEEDVTPDELRRAEIEEYWQAYLTARRNAPLWHSSEIEWDPRDFPRPENPQTPRMMTRDYLVWVAVIIIVGTGILLNL